MNDDGRSSDALEGGFPATYDSDRFRHLIEHIQDAVVEFEFVDDEPIVRGINPAFIEVFGYGPDEVLEQSLNECIVPPWLETEATTLDDRTTAGKVNYRRVRRETADGVREFLYRGIPYRIASGERVADAIDADSGEPNGSNAAAGALSSDGRRGFAVYTDLTEDRRNRSRVHVLNRVLRHNLRNKVTLVAGSVESLLEELDDDALDPTARMLADNVDAGVDELRTLTREASDLYRIANASIPEDPRVDSVPLARTVAGRYGLEYPDVSIDLDVPGRLWVAATDRLEIAVESLVENAIVHNPCDEPRVWLEVERESAEWCTIAVADDGPGIPPVEREVVTGESEITDLHHGSGLGLWLVKWTVETFGGEITFDRSEAGGSRVQLRLRRWTGDE
ncbi:ATP-binding protein [Natrarchaeobaculum aegyptiacum]|uniref:histidine kinase n=1 Tax=Natrarchaeobaculum aegyptiacum TaxID=745377 RepID=A0A2Z2HWR5_9EURY|nr:ATP-binding protein [Natrarchaeobaculum aegyptiacum]ARS91700.1 hypothetical protein B1756_05510 [Natrarchaeobaculum aegyptiacum]